MTETEMFLPKLPQQQSQENSKEIVGQGSMKAIALEGMIVLTNKTMRKGEV